MNRPNSIRLLNAGMWVLMLPLGVQAQPQVTNARQPGHVSRLPDTRQPTHDFRFEGPQQQAVQSLDGDLLRITKPSRTITPPDDPEKKKTRSTGSFGTTLVALSFVVGLILVAAKLWSKHGPLVNSGLPPEAFEVLGLRRLDQRQTVYLARLGSRILVLGSSTDGLRTLCEITDPIEVDFLAGACRRGDGNATAAQAFRALFKKQVSTAGASNRCESLPNASSLGGASLTARSRREAPTALETPTVPERASPPETRLEKMRA